MNIPTSGFIHLESWRQNTHSQIHKKNGPCGLLCQKYYARFWRPSAHSRDNNEKKTQVTRSGALTELLVRGGESKLLSRCPGNSDII